ncbi:hypothetical protein PHLGIDRAFT_74282, partial [Phlebiopsis gigantea 11061_1 CR5-6]
SLFIACVALGLYEYIITLASEVETVWKRPWTVSSILFLSIRWNGLLFPVLGTISITLEVSPANRNRLI